MVVILMMSEIRCISLESEMLLAGSFMRDLGFMPMQAASQHPLEILSDAAALNIYVSFGFSTR